MPTVRFREREVECDRGDVLRDVLLDAGLDPHNGASSALNCRGHGTCGTCAVEIDGPVSDRGALESRRLLFPPHDADSGLRLACQTRIEGDLDVTKHDGFWGHLVDSD